MLLYFLLAAGAAVLGYEIYGSTKPAKGNLGFLVVPAGANVMEPDGTLSTLDHDTASTDLRPGSFIGGAGDTDYIVMSDGSLATYGTGAQFSGVITLPAGTTVMAPDGSNSTLTSDTSSSSLAAGTAVFDDGAVYIVDPNGTLHTAQPVA